MFRPDQEARHYPVVTPSYKTAAVDYLGLSLDELRKRCAEELLLSFLTEKTPQAGKYIAGLCYCQFHINAVDALTLEELRQIVGIGHLRNELALEAQRYGRIGGHDAVEFRSGVLQLGIGELEWCEIIGHTPREVPGIGIGCVELRHLEIVRPVQHTCTEGDGGPVQLPACPAHECRSQ